MANLEHRYSTKTELRAAVTRPRLAWEHGYSNRRIEAEMGLLFFSFFFLISHASCSI